MSDIETLKQIETLEREVKGRPTMVRHLLSTLLDDPKIPHTHASNGRWIARRATWWTSDDRGGGTASPEILVSYDGRLLFAVNTDTPMITGVSRGLGSGVPSGINSMLKEADIYLTDGTRLTYYKLLVPHKLPSIVKCQNYLRHVSDENGIAIGLERWVPPMRVEDAIM